MHTIRWKSASVAPGTQRWKARARARSLTHTHPHTHSLSLVLVVLISPPCPFLVRSRSHVRSFAFSRGTSLHRLAHGHRETHTTRRLPDTPQCDPTRMQPRNKTGPSRTRPCLATTMFQRRYAVRATRRTYMFGYPTCNGASHGRWMHDG